MTARPTAAYELVATDPNVRVIDLKINLGKGGAMRAGVKSTDADVVLFLDADLVGMDGQKVDAIVRPVVNDQADMAIGIFKGGRGATDFAQLVAPYISGQRAMRREVFLTIPKIDSTRSGVESAITKYFRAHRLRVQRVKLPGCTHCMKEEKLGLAKGLASRMRMYYDIGKILLDGRELRKKD